MVGWIAPQFEAMRGSIDPDQYSNVPPAWVVKCMEPNIDAYMKTIPISTFMGLQSCDYTGYIADYPEMNTFDMSAISATDFIAAMPPGGVPVPAGLHLAVEKPNANRKPPGDPPFCETDMR
jgi:hypothetical protein